MVLVVKCAKCGTENREGAKWCRECGGGLVGEPREDSARASGTSTPDATADDGAPSAGVSSAPERTSSAQPSVETEADVDASAAGGVETLGVFEHRGAETEPKVSSPPLDETARVAPHDQNEVSHGAPARPDAHSSTPSDGITELTADHLSNTSYGHLWEIDATISGRYVVVKAPADGDARAVTIVRDLEAWRCCAHCASTTNGLGAEYCESCGGDLTDQRYEAWSLPLIAQNAEHDLFVVGSGVIRGDPWPTIREVTAEGVRITDLLSPTTWDAAIPDRGVRGWLDAAATGAEALGNAGLAARFQAAHLAWDRQRRIVWCGMEHMTAADSDSLAEMWQSVGETAAHMASPRDSDALLDWSELQHQTVACISGLTRGRITSVESVHAALSAPTPPVTGFQVCGLSDVGMRRRNNEDGLAWWQGASVFEGSDRSAGLFVVADGMGGGEAGERACKVAVDALGDAVDIATLLSSPAPRLGELKERLQSGVLAASAAVVKDGDGQPYMGATVTAALVVGSVATIANVGDARTYVVDASHTLRQITEDHSVVWQRVKAGTIAKEEIPQQPDRNVITRAVDNGRVLDPADVDVFQIVLAHGDGLLLCSDGVWEMVPDALIEAELKAARDLPAACRAIIARANEAGGDDNATIVLVS